MKFTALKNGDSEIQSITPGILIEGYLNLGNNSFSNTWWYYYQFGGKFTLANYDPQDFSGENTYNFWKIYQYDGVFIAQNVSHCSFSLSNRFYHAISCLIQNSLVSFISIDYSWNYLENNNFTLENSECQSIMVFGKKKVAKKSTDKKFKMAKTTKSKDVKKNNNLKFLIHYPLINFILYKSKLVPRWLSGWGFVGALLLWAYYLLQFFSINQVDILFLPIAVQEMVFAVWLIINGFNLYAIDSATAKIDVNEIK